MNDSHITPPPGTMIAEFANGQDALDFSRLKGRKYTVTPGVSFVFAVRVAEFTELLPHGDSL